MKTWKRNMIGILTGTILGSASKFFPATINAGIISALTTFFTLQALRTMIPERRNADGNIRESDS